MSVGNSCDKSDVLRDLFPDVNSGTLKDTPVFLELCAGSAKLSDAVRKHGYCVVPVDHDHNKHHPRCTIVQLDLSQQAAWDQLNFLVENVPIAGVHFAPPCGTCSKARGIPLPDGSAGPQPLRSQEFCLGYQT